MPNLVRKTELSKSKNRGYRRYLFGAHFDLGHDKAQAEKRLNAIVRLWAYNLERIGMSPGRKKDFIPRDFTPYWLPELLSIARSISRGETPQVSPCNEVGHNHLEQLQMIEAITGVKVESSNPLRLELNLYELQQEASRRQLQLQKRTGQRLFAALSAYSDWIEENFSPSGGITDHAKNVKNRLRSIKWHIAHSFKGAAANCDLAELDLPTIDRLVGCIRQRPITQTTTRPMAFKTTEELLKILKRFFKWLDRQPTWHFRLPDGFAQVSFRPIELDEDAEKELAEIPTWTVEELATIYQYASPLIRILMLLGLNCAYGADQSGRLRAHHLHLDRKRIRAIRRKKRVLSIHRTWAATVGGLRWLLERRISQDDLPLFLTRYGTPMYRKTKSGNRSRDIPNKWAETLRRVKKDHPGFRSLPFNSLRDTSIDMIRQIAGGEIASLHAAHKHQTADRNLRSYSNPMRRKHAKAVRRLERKMQAVFDSVADPFPASQPQLQKLGGENITPGQKSRIIRLFQQGFKKQKIAEEVGVSRVTVWRHLRGVKRTKPKPR